MSTVKCPGCGGQFPLAAVAQYEQFTCSQCGHIVAVPAAAPAQPVQPARPAASRPAAATHPAATSQSKPATSAGRRTGAGSAARPAARRAAPAPAPEPEPRGRSSGGRRGDSGGGAPAKKGPPVPLLAGGALLLVAAIAFIALKGGDDLPDAVPVGATTAGGGDGAGSGDAGSGGPGGAGPGSGDPDKDPAAWAMLDETARKDRVNMMVARAETESDPILQKTAAFLLERNELEGRKRLARLYVARNPTADWANEILGRKELSGEVRSVLRECELADDVQLEEVLVLNRLLAKHTGEKGRNKWWADGEQLAMVNGLLADLRDAETQLSGSEAALGRARWITWRRTVEVFKDFPTLSAHVGPYLLFVQIKSDKGTNLEDVDPEARKKAKEVLDRNIALFEQMYEGWMSEIAPHFGFERYTDDSVDHSTILKANVFADREEYMRYIRHAGGPSGARAYYSKAEPRFITTYEGDGKTEDGQGETLESTNQVQCHEATHQLVHFYTWDTTRKIIGRPPKWLDALTRPLWSSEGFAEFFSSHTVDNGKYTWMAPLDERMQQLWIFDEVIRKKSWEPWSLDQIFGLRNGGQLQGLAQARANEAGDAGKAVMVMSNQFYAEAWSFVYFLWNAKAGGSFKYRDKLIEYFKLEFELDYGQRDGKKRNSPRLMLDSDFRRVFGMLNDAAKEKALYTEWKAFEKALLDEHRKPEWKTERERIFKVLDMNPNE